MAEIKQLQDAVDYIEHNITEDLTSSEIAKQACMSTFHFQRLFSILCGYTVGEYIRNRRLSLSATELQVSEKSIIDIAFRYGYDTPEGFTRAFHRYFGITPSAARDRKTVLPKFEKLSVQNTLLGGMVEMDDMTRYGKRGYYVKENAPIYFTIDMDRTCKWFCDVLGWYGDICGRDDNDIPVYGCVFDYPGELIVANLTSFRGIHLFKGEPNSGEVGFINIQGLNTFHQFVKDNGWNQISDINEQPWGAKECSVTTIDGSVIRFFETTI
ncbi:MAG TPA: AraC family transcriptional regulator [Lachnospiraceae bacterium]|nr:AraC family transcriptional regulator [Lachnospiraceae bacterium]